MSERALYLLEMVFDVDHDYHSIILCMRRIFYSRRLEGFTPLYLLYNFITFISKEQINKNLFLILNVINLSELQGV